MHLDINTCYFKFSTQLFLLYPRFQSPPRHFIYIYLSAFIETDEKHVAQPLQFSINSFDQIPCSHLKVHRADRIHDWPQQLQRSKPFLGIIKEYYSVYGQRFMVVCNVTLNSVTIFLIGRLVAHDRFHNVSQWRWDCGVHHPHIVGGVFIGDAAHDAVDYFELPSAGHPCQAHAILHFWTVVLISEIDTSHCRPNAESSSTGRRFRWRKWHCLYEGHLILVVGIICRCNTIDAWLNIKLLYINAICNKTLFSGCWIFQSLAQLRFLWLNCLLVAYQERHSGQPYTLQLHKPIAK